MSFPLYFIWIMLLSALPQAQICYFESVNFNLTIVSTWPQDSTPIAVKPGDDLSSCKVLVLYFPDRIDPEIVKEYFESGGNVVLFIPEGELWSLVEAANMTGIALSILPEYRYEYIIKYDYTTKKVNVLKRLPFLEGISEIEVWEPTPDPVVHLSGGELIAELEDSEGRLYLGEGGRVLLFLNWGQPDIGDTLLVVNAIRWMAGLSLVERSQLLEPRIERPELKSLERNGLVPLMVLTPLLISVGGLTAYAFWRRGKGMAG